MVWDAVKVEGDPLPPADWNAMVLYLKGKGNKVVVQTTAPTTAVDGEYWFDTTPGATRLNLKVAGAWVNLSITGATGPKGDTGSTGATGAKGDKGDTGAAGTAGTNGTDGADGKTVRYGTIPPTTEGADGDFYIDITAHMVYGPKAAGTWPAGTSMIGPAGDGGAGSGDVVGPASATDNAISRFDGTGKLLQNSLATIDDSGSINIPTGQAYKINGTALAAADVGAAATGHDHTGTYLPAAGKAADSELLDGIDSTGFVQVGDTSTTNARTPTAHKSTHATAGTDALSASDIGAAASNHNHDSAYLAAAGTAADSSKLGGALPAAYVLASTIGTAAAKNVPATGDATATEAVLGSDTRLTDARAPTTHNHDAAYAPIAKGVTNGDSHDHNGGDGAQIAYSALSGAPTSMAPTAHASTHATGQTDALTPANIGAEPAITTLSISKGGTGTTTAPAAGKLLIGKTDGTYASANITPGANITVTNADGAITIAATAGTGATLDAYGHLSQGAIGTQIGAVDPTTADGDLIYRKKTTISSYVIGAIGDSIFATGTYSAGADPITQLSTALSHSALTVSRVNRGITTTSTADWQPGGTNYNAAVAAFASGGVNAVLVMLGTNDAWDIVNTSTAQYLANMSAITNDLVNRGYLVFLAYPPYNSKTDRSAALTQAYQFELNKLANNQTVFVVGRQDYTYFAANPSLLSDGLHPTEQGAALLAAHLWAPEIAPIIAQRTGIATLQRLTLGTNLSITDGVINAAGGGSATRLAAITKSVAIATTDAAAGKTDSVDLTCSYGQISRIRVRADWTAGQQSGPGTFQVNNAAGITAAATTIAIDTGSAGFTLAAGDEVWIDNECILCGSTTSATSIANATRAYAGTIATIHQDNVMGYKANDGLTLDLYPSSSRVPAERLLRLSGIMTESLTTSAAIGAGDHAVRFTTSPIVVSDVGRGSLFRVADTTSDLVRVQDVYGAVSESGISAYANSITTYDTLTAHDTAKNVQRVIEYDLVVPFKFPTGTALYLTLTPVEKIAATVNATIEFIVDQFGA